MKISLAASLTLAMLAEVAVARNCDGGLNYCGKTLNKIGDYEAEIQSACGQVHISCRDGYGDNYVLFECKSSVFGNHIAVENNCGEYGLKCIDGGAGKSDTCG
ncbi:hypothetical protein Q7P36_010742 [Cladosporium allicinum]